MDPTVRTVVDVPHARTRMSWPERDEHSTGAPSPPLASWTRTQTSAGKAERRAGAGRAWRNQRARSRQARPPRRAEGMTARPRLPRAGAVQRWRSRSSRPRTRGSPRATRARGSAPRCGAPHAGCTSVRPLRQSRRSANSSSTSFSHSAPVSRTVDLGRSRLRARPVEVVLRCVAARWYLGRQVRTVTDQADERPEVIAWDALVAAGGYGAARGRGELRSEGCEYLVRDDEVMHIRFHAVTAPLTSGRCSCARTRRSRKCSRCPGTPGNCSPRPSRPRSRAGPQRGRRRPPDRALRERLRRGA
jgi:hypothetical protein